MKAFRSPGPICCTLLAIFLFSLTAGAREIPSSTTIGVGPTTMIGVWPTAMIGHRPTTSMESAILYYVNQHRLSRHLPALRLNSMESGIAAQHSRDMATGKTGFGHAGLHDRFNLIRRSMPSITLIGENVASGQMSAKEVVDGWLNSPGHRRNIEGNFTLTGIGLARDWRGMIFYTQIFTR